MSEQIANALTTPVAPFDFVSAEAAAQELRVFVNAESCLGKLYRDLSEFFGAGLVPLDQHRLSYADGHQRAASLANTLHGKFSIGQGTLVAIAARKVPAELHIVNQPLARNATAKVLEAEAKSLYQAT